MKGAAVGAQEGARRGSHRRVLEQLELGTRPDEPGSGEQLTGTGVTTGAGAKAAAASAVPAAPAAEANTPIPAGKAVRGAPDAGEGSPFVDTVTVGPTRT
ncbi:hypothetical protein [Rhodococcus wratislaviensis]|uniref:hypothetical protein n=1 Tax=Rhodococcus wratislaviensis TaxID=44752 RepID=UPI003518E495